MPTEDIFINKIKEIRLALSLELYNSALALSLTLPDVCGKVEFPKHQTKERYTKWFEKYAQNQFISMVEKIPENILVEYKWLTASECYQLRCAVLHAGDYKIKCNTLHKIHLHAHKRNGENYSHTLRTAGYIDADVIELCEGLCKAAEEYHNSIDDKSRFDLDEVIIETW